MMGESLEIKVTRCEGRLDEHDHQIKELQKNVEAMNNLSQSMTILGDKQDNLGEKIDNLTNRLDKNETEVGKLKGAGGEKWNLLTKTLLAAVITTSVGILLTALFAVILK